jgi:hypothetical protein
VSERKKEREIKRETREREIARASATRETPLE